MKNGNLKILDFKELNNAFAPSCENFTMFIIFICSQSQSLLNSSDILIFVTILEYMYDSVLSKNT